jgi:hypothetical protein
VVHEDVVKFLMDRGVIKPLKDRSIYSEEDLAGYSKEMKVFLAEVMQGQLPPKRQEFVALDERLLREIGNRFRSKYVLRGRVLEMGTSSLDTFNPVQTGIIPFVFKTGSRLIFGVASTETYETVNRAVFGAMMAGALIQESSPLRPKRFDEQDRSNIEDINRAIWGAGVPGLGILGSKSGEVAKGVVQIEMLLQDTLTGEPIWANRIGIEVVPESAFSLVDKKALVKAAVEEAVERLIEDLAVTLNARS